MSYIPSFDQDLRSCASHVIYVTTENDEKEYEDQDPGLRTPPEILEPVKEASAENDSEESDSGEELDIFNSLTCSYCSDIGEKKAENQDRYLEKTSLPSYRDDTSQYIAMGVFDGHNGYTCAEYCKSNLHKNIAGALCNFGKENLKESDIRKAHKIAYNLTDKNFMKHHKVEISGSTSVTALFYGPDEDNELSLYLSHAGDSYAILGRKDGSQEKMTDDHKPNRPDEQKRIEALGPDVAQVVLVNGCHRVVIKSALSGGNMGLAVSRSFGDDEFKSSGSSGKEVISSVPEVKRYIVNREEDDFLVLASDGISDGLTVDEVGAIVRANRRSPHVARAVVEAAGKKGSKDDRTVAIAFFDWDNELAKQHQEAECAEEGVGVPTITFHYPESIGL